MARLEDYDGQPQFFTEPVRGFRLFRIKDRGLTQVASAMAYHSILNINNNRISTDAICIKYPEDYFIYLQQVNPGTVPFAYISHTKRITEVRLRPVFKALIWDEDYPNLDPIETQIETVDTIQYIHAPVQSCSCGYWGVYDPFKAVHAVSFRSNMFVIMCAVEASGKVVLGTEGFRAQRIKITGVVTDPMSGLPIRWRHTSPILDPIPDDFSRGIAKEPLIELYTKSQLGIIKKVFKDPPLINNLDTYLSEFPITNPEDYGG